MKALRLHLYTIDIKYIRNLSKIDNNVMSVSPQINKQTRPFVGIVVVCNNYKYCIPLSSPKSKHLSMKNDKDFSKIFDKTNKLIGVLNFNNMIPVAEEYLKVIDIRILPQDNQYTKKYKSLMNDQLDWCNNNKEIIIKKANKLHELITSGKCNNLLRKRCCDFAKLDAYYLKNYKN